MSCPTEETLLLVIDGGIAPNQLEGIQAHLARCSMCREAMAELETLAGDLAEPVGFDPEAHVQQVISRLGEPRPASPSMRARMRPASATAIGVGVSVVALAAGVVLLVGVPHGPRLEDGSFQPRGSKQPPSLARDVGVRVLGGEGALARLTSDAQVSAGATFSATYTNIHPRPVYLLLFAVDAANTVHWLYPAYTSPTDDPPSILLEPTDRERALPTSVVLDGPAKGAMRFVSVTTESPLRVSDIEPRSAGDLAAEALRRAFPAASIAELQVRVTGE